MENEISSGRRPSVRRTSKCEGRVRRWHTFRVFRASPVPYTAARMPCASADDEVLAWRVCGRRIAPRHACSMNWSSGPLRRGRRPDDWALCSVVRQDGRRKPGKREQSLFLCRIAETDPAKSAASRDSVVPGGQPGTPKAGLDQIFLQDRQVTGRVDIDLGTDLLSPDSLRLIRGYLAHARAAGGGGFEDDVAGQDERDLTGRSRAHGARTSGCTRRDLQRRADARRARPRVRRSRSAPEALTAERLAHGVVGIRK